MWLSVVVAFYFVIKRQKSATVTDETRRDAGNNFKVELSFVCRYAVAGAAVAGHVERRIFCFCYLSGCLFIMYKYRGFPLALELSNPKGDMCALRANRLMIMKDLPNQKQTLDLCESHI